jgi:hypothetical protein
MRFNYEKRDHLDIVDFITSTLELQEETYKAERDLEDEYVEAFFNNKSTKAKVETQMDLLEDKYEDEGYVPSLYSL